MRKWMLAFAGFGAVGVGFLALAKPLPAARPDVNAICGPKLTKQLDDAVFKHLWHAVHVSWAVQHDTMKVDGIFAAGEQSYYVTANCIVKDGRPQVLPLVVR